MRPAETAREVAYVFQNPDHQIFAATVQDEVAFGPRNFGLPDDEIRRRCDEALEAVGLQNERQSDPFLLSKGERQRLAVASVPALRPRMLILDEPTTGLEHRVQRREMAPVCSLLIMFWAGYWVDNPIALLPIGLVMLWIAQLTDSWPNFYRLRWLFAILVFTTTIAWMVFYRRGAVLVNIPVFHVSRLSLVFGLGRGIKLAELLAASVLFLSTTKIEEFTYGLQRMRVPYRVSFAISLSFRLVPLFIDSAGAIGG